MIARSPSTSPPTKAGSCMEQFSAIHNQPIATKNNGYDGLDAELVFNKTQFVQYVTDLKSWYDQGLVKIKSKDLGQDMVQAFAAGDCQMILTSVGDHGTIGRTAKEGMNWDVAELPVYAGTERKNSLVGGASLWVLSGKSDDEYKGAAAFLNFIARPEDGSVLVDQHRLHPGDQVGLRLHEVARASTTRRPIKGREVAIASLTASEPTADHPRHPPRRLHADPRRIRQPAAGDLRQQGQRPGRPRHAGQERQRHPRPLRSRPTRASSCPDQPQLAWPSAASSLESTGGRFVITSWPLERHRRTDGKARHLSPGGRSASCSQCRSCC